MVGVNRTLVRTRDMVYDEITFKLVDVVASCEVAGYKFLIHASERGFVATYAPVGLSCGGSHATVADAIAAVMRYADSIPRAIERALTSMAENHTPLLSPETGIEISDWKWRERCRFESGEYKPVPAIDGYEYPWEHYLHLSVTKTETDHVAYTPTEAYGVADRQVRMKFGRYLRKTFESMSDADIQREVTGLRAKMAIIDAPSELKFATDRETINRIFETRMYATCSSGDSCMYGKFRGETRPYHVYADSPDVAVAYLVDKGEITSRSVVSTKDKTWVRCYSIEADGSTMARVLQDALHAAGYREGTLKGNRLTKLNTDNVMLPYIDNGGVGVWDRDQYWVVADQDDGDYLADCTDGSATEHREMCDRCDYPQDECRCSHCECCDRSYADGCDSCSFCGDCDGCTEHNGCDCIRCSNCGEIIDPRHSYTPRCDCQRCDECKELTDDCECDPEEDESESETITPEVSA